MLSEQEVKRIKREIDGVRGLDVPRYLEGKMPWLRPIGYTVRRLSDALTRLRVNYVLLGEYVLRFYGVPHPSRELVFAVRLDEFERLGERLAGEGFRRLAAGGRELRLLDLAANNSIAVYDEPRPLKWDQELERRVFEVKEGVKVLAAEDYAVILILRQEVRERELAAKVIYASIDRLDEDYLRKRAEEYGVLREVEELLRELG